MENLETTMDKYADVVMRELNRYNMVCIYEQGKEQIYSCFVCRYGNVWGTYGILDIEP